MDRFHSWTDSATSRASFGRDELLTNIMLYWVTQTIGPSMFNYYAENALAFAVPGRPCGAARGPGAVPQGHRRRIPPRSFAERTLNVQRWTEMPRGSHFAAWEEPELFARDVAEFFQGPRGIL